MKLLKKHIAAFLLTFCVSCTDMACMEQYNPTGFWNKLKEEEKIANKPAPTLTTEGKLKEKL